MVHCFFDVKCRLLSLKEKEAIIGINDTGNHRLSAFRVKTSDLISKIDSEDLLKT